MKVGLPRYPRLTTSGDSCDCGPMVAQTGRVYLDTALLFYYAVLPRMP